MSAKYIHLPCLGLLALLGVSTVSAQPRSSDALGQFIPVESHSGQVDTDGILSPGEIPNSNIDYERSQRKAERRGDYRVDNPENDAAARDDRAEDRRNAYEHDQYRHERSDDRRADDHRDEQRRSWWHWWN